MSLPGPIRIDASSTVMLMWSPLVSMDQYYQEPLGPWPALLYSFRSSKSTQWVVLQTQTDYRLYHMQPATFACRGVPLQTQSRGGVFSWGIRWYRESSAAVPMRR